MRYQPIQFLQETFLCITYIYNLILTYNIVIFSQNQDVVLMIKFVMIKWSYNHKYLVKSYEMETLW